MLILLALPATEGAAVITGTGWRRGGGPATWARWSMARASASTLDGARGLSARIVSITPPPGHYEPGAVGLHRRSERSDRRAVSDRTAAWRTSRTKNRAGRQATGILKHCEPVPGVLLPCSLTVPSCEARRRRGIARATALFPAYSPSYTGASRVRLSFLSRQKPSRSLTACAS